MHYSLLILIWALQLVRNLKYLVNQKTIFSVIKMLGSHLCLHACMLANLNRSSNYLRNCFSLQVRESTDYPIYNLRWDSNAAILISMSQFSEHQKKVDSFAHYSQAKLIHFIHFSERIVKSMSFGKLLSSQRIIWVVNTDISCAHMDRSVENL